MKPSNYNIFLHYEPDNVYIGYNAVSNGFYIFDGRQYGQVKDILANAGNLSSSDSNKSIRTLFFTNKKNYKYSKGGRL